MEGFIELFDVPPAALPVLDLIVDRDEKALIEGVASSPFGLGEAVRALGSGWDRQRTMALLRRAYRRGVLRLEDEGFTRFRTGRFYDRLDVFAVTEPEAWSALPGSIRASLDSWYFAAYLAGLSDGPRPTADRVVSLGEALDFIDGADRPIWLGRCDCRTLAGRCDAPTDTCISLRGGINTMSHRGWSKPVTADEAKRVVRDADGAGLMHTVNPNGLCNCCGDCCYLFRAQAARGCGAAWPEAGLIADLKADLCVGCGRCVERCHFDAFALEGGRARCDRSRCRGCGLCAETCPARAISMIERERRIAR
jgi:ferredoxin